MKPNFFRKYHRTMWWCSCIIVLCIRTINTCILIVHPELIEERIINFDVTIQLSMATYYQLDFNALLGLVRGDGRTKFAHFFIHNINNNQSSEMFGNRFLAYKKPQKYNKHIQMVLNALAPILLLKYVISCPSCVIRS